MWKWHPILLVLGPGFITRLGGGSSGSGSTTGTGSGVVLVGLPVPVHEEGVYTVQSQGRNSENLQKIQSMHLLIYMWKKIAWYKLPSTLYDVMPFFCLHVSICLA